MPSVASSANRRGRRSGCRGLIPSCLQASRQARLIPLLACVGDDIASAAVGKGLIESDDLEYVDYAVEITRDEYVHAIAV